MDLDIHLIFAGIILLWFGPMIIANIVDSIRIRNEIKQLRYKSMLSNNKTSKGDINPLSFDDWTPIGYNDPYMPQPNNDIHIHVENSVPVKPMIGLCPPVQVEMSLGQEIEATSASICDLINTINNWV